MSFLSQIRNSATTAPSTIVFTADGLQNRRQDVQEFWKSLDGPNGSIVTTGHPYRLSGTVWPAAALPVSTRLGHQVTIGLFMDTFVYICIVLLVTHQDPQSSFIPQISLITSWVLVVLSFGFLVYYSHRVARSIQNPDMIVDDLYAAAGGALLPGPGEGTGAVPDDNAILRQAETGAIVSCAKSEYLVEELLEKLAKATWLGCRGA